MSQASVSLWDASQARKQGRVLVIERVAAIDVARAAGKVCVRPPGRSGRRFSRAWDVPARTGAIGELAEQLFSLRVEVPD